MSFKPLPHQPANDVGEVRFRGTLDARDEQLDQVRELLFGDFERRQQQRLVAIEDRLARLEARFEALAAEQTKGRQDLMNDLSRGISDLSDYVRHIARP